ncbi:MAG TPA: YraN family protein [Gammaproteobacteria bacterium]|nr:YraN family protein [Gammaproteobacteria bacterium]
MTLARGREAEDRALAYLRAHGLELVARNYRCPRGEIDLVMREDDTLVVVEVRYRRGTSHGSAFESVDARKQARIIRATEHFLAIHGGLRNLRFDVMALSDDGGRERIDWLRDAFRPSAR